MTFRPCAGAVTGRTMAADKLTFVVHLKPTPQCRDPIKSLRATLKMALRAWNLRCVTIATTNGDRIASFAEDQSSS